MSNLFARTERSHMAEFRHQLNKFGRRAETNPWFERSVHKLTVDGPLTH